MTNATFFNFTNEDFIGHFNGRPYTFKAGEKRFMDAGYAKHFAKHLVNRELIKQGLDTMTSPKDPEQVPKFWELFTKACVVDESSIEQDAAQGEIARANNEVSSDIYTPKAKEVGPGKEPTIITGPADDSEENAEFDGLKEDEE